MKSKFQVLIPDKLSNKVVGLLESKGIKTNFCPEINEKELLTIIADYDALLVRSKVKITAELIACAKKLKVVGRAGIGVDNIDIPFCTKKGIIVMNSPLGNSITTAEHTLALIFSLARHIPQANNSTHNGKWEKSKFIGIELTEKKLGLIGVGNIGSIVAKKSLGLGLNVIAYDPFLTNKKASQLGIKKLDWEDFLKQADIISLHIPKTENTIGIIGEKEFQKMKKGVMIINSARGGLIDEKALKKYLQNGKIFGAAIDVYEKEPAKESIFFGLPNIICTPHLGASTSQAQTKVSLQIAEQISDYLLHGAIHSSINMPSITEQEYKFLSPYIKLANYLSSFISQTIKGKVSGINIEYSGEIAKLNFNFLTQQIIKNITEPIFDNVNFVNAKEIAKDRGMKISVINNEFYTDYPSLITIKTYWEKQIHSISGILIKNKPRIIQIKGIQLEADFKPFMLYINNLDKPGFIGYIGSILGKNNVNIASFHLGRSKPGKDAIALIELDQPIIQEVMDKVKKIPYVLQIQNLKFS